MWECLFAKAKVHNWIQRSDYKEKIKSKNARDWIVPPSKILLLIHIIQNDSEIVAVMITKIPILHEIVAVTITKIPILHEIVTMTITKIPILHNQFQWTIVPRICFKNLSCLKLFIFSWSTMILLYNRWNYPDWSMQ